MNSKRYFICSACFLPSFAPNTNSGRETLNCYWCKSTSRERAILLEIHKSYFKMKIGKPFRSLKILGVSDGYLTSTVLTKIYRKQYSNYHYHLDPKLDITEVSVDLYGSADIISCSEVLEHVEPPIQKAFHGLYQLLRVNGKLVLSVPHTDINGKHVEHFPVMKESRILPRESSLVLRGKGANGELHEFSNLTFHGGIGATLEYRIFSKNSLEQNLKAVGFKNLKSCNNKIFFGIRWEPWSRVWTAIK